MDKKEFLNEKMRTHGKYSAGMPKSLYKYRPFDRFSFDMLENKYIYLCRVADLDDPAECRMEIDMKELLDFDRSGSMRGVVDRVFDFLRPHTTPENFEIVKSSVCQLVRRGTIQSSSLSDWACEVQKYLSEDVDITYVVNLMKMISAALSTPAVPNYMATMVKGALDAREYMGVCSLSECCDSDRMWESYADGGRGYCVEYDTDTVGHDTLFPVVYSEKPERNILDSIMNDYLEAMIENMDGGPRSKDRSQTLRLFLTKDVKWNYQREWRIIGDAGERKDAPGIRRIILGRNVSIENERTMTIFCGGRNIKLDKCLPDGTLETISPFRSSDDCPDHRDVLHRGDTCEK